MRLAVRFSVALVAISARMERHIPKVARVICELQAAQPAITVVVSGVAFLRDPDPQTVL